jgi:hypothetical protein
VSYVYAEQRANLFTEAGVEVLTEVRRNVERALKAAGAFRVEEVMAVGDSWTVLAAIDYMVEKGEIREVTDREKVWGQHRVFVRGS